MARLTRLINSARYCFCGRPRNVNTGNRASGGRQRVIALTRGLQTKIALLTAAIRENWRLVLVSSLDEGQEMLEDSPVEMFIYDHNFGGDGWHNLCRTCAERGIAFEVVACEPSDELFLAVIGAGGMEVVWKPLTAQKVISAMRLARTLAEERFMRGELHPMQRY